MKKLSKYQNISKSLHKEWGSNTQELLHNMSHEFKTPMSAIQLNAQLLEKMLDQKAGDQLKFFSKYIERIMGVSQRVVSVVDDTLYLVQIMNESPELSFNKMSLGEVFQELTIAFENYYPNKKFEVIKPETYTEIMVDRLTFMGALKRLIAITLEVGAEEMPLVKLEEHEGRLNIEVQAPHLRIKESHKKVIFEPFSSLSEFNQVEALPLRLGLIKKLLKFSQVSIDFDHKDDGLPVFRVDVQDINNQIKVAS